MASYSIRKMSLDEVNRVAIRWAADEGWNPGVQDGQAFYQTDPGGFYIGELNKEPIACISVVKYPENFAFLGFYIVKPQYRGRGYGLKIWNHALSGFGKYNIGLDGVVESQDDYIKSGFKLAYRNIRFQGRSQTFNDRNENIKVFNASYHDDLFRYDTELFPVPRKIFLREWLQLKEAYKLIYLKDNKISGYTVIRKCLDGFKFGPLFADDYDIAESLFKEAQSKITEGENIFLDIPETNHRGLEIAEKYNMKKVFETARMYTGVKPEIDLSKVYGVTTFELG